MNLLKNVLAWFGYRLVKESEDRFYLPENSQELIKKIENEKIDAIQRTVSALVTVVANMNNKMSEHKLQVAENSDYLVEIASLQEQLLHELDQGKVVIIKTGADEIAAALSGTLSDDDADTLAMSHGSHISSMDDPKKKFDLN